MTANGGGRLWKSTVSCFPPPQGALDVTPRRRTPQRARCVCGNGAPMEVNGELLAATARCGCLHQHLLKAVFPADVSCAVNHARVQRLQRLQSCPQTRSAVHSSCSCFTDLHRALPCPCKHWRRAPVEFARAG